MRSQDPVSSCKIFNKIGHTNPKIKKNKEKN
jgi:hypothetical protein